MEMVSAYISQKCENKHIQEPSEYFSFFIKLWNSSLVSYVPEQ